MLLTRWMALLPTARVAELQKVASQKWKVKFMWSYFFLQLLPLLFGFLFCRHWGDLVGLLLVNTSIQFVSLTTYAYFTYKYCWLLLFHFFFAPVWSDHVHIVSATIVCIAQNRFYCIEKSTRSFGIVTTRLANGIARQYFCRTRLICNHLFRNLDNQFGVVTAASIEHMCDLSTGEHMTWPNSFHAFVYLNDYCLNA